MDSLPNEKCLLLLSGNRDGDGEKSKEFYDQERQTRVLNIPFY